MVRSVADATPLTELPMPVPGGGDGVARREVRRRGGRCVSWLNLLLTFYEFFRFVLCFDMNMSTLLKYDKMM